MIYHRASEIVSLLAPQGRLLGLDVGGKRIGVALSDEGRMIGTALEVYTRQNNRKDMGHVSRLLREHCCVGIVVGWPTDEQGGPTDGTAIVEAFSARIDKDINLPQLMWDERFSTRAATSALKESGMRRKKREAIDDKVAASFILQGALDALRVAACH